MRFRFPLIIAIYSLLVFASLGATPLWLDEVLHLNCARIKTWSALIVWVQVNAGGVPLSYFLQELAIRTLGFSTVAVRLPAALASIAGAIVFIAILKRLKCGTPTLVLLMFLLVPLQFRYAVEGVGYSLGLCFCLVSFWTFLRFIETPSLGLAAAYAISIVLGLYSQPLVIFPAVAQVLWTAKFGNRRQLGLAVGALTFAVLAFLPWHFAQQEVQRYAGTMKIVFFSWQQVRPWVLLHDVVGGGYAVAIPLIVLAAYGFYWRRRSAEQALIFVTLLGAWVGPLLTDGILNYFFASRQLLFAIPFLVLLAGSGAAELWERKRWLPAVCVAVVMGASLVSDYRQVVNPKDDLMIAARTAQSWVGQDGCLSVTPSNWSAYFTFFEPNLVDRECKPSSAARIVSVTAAAATGQEREALSRAIPTEFAAKEKAMFREIDLTVYERASSTPTTSSPAPGLQ